jgi:hypothetical protein
VRLLAALLSLLILVEGSGVARALSGESIECCCGRHDAHRVCKCPSCPVSKNRKDHTSRFAAGCDGHDEPAALVVTAVMTPAPSLAPLVAVASWAPVVKSLSDRVVEAGRPPP